MAYDDAGGLGAGASAGAELGSGGGMDAHAVEGSSFPVKRPSALEKSSLEVLDDRETSCFDAALDGTYLD